MLSRAACAEEPRSRPSVEGAAVKDRLWLWGHAAGAHNEEWNLPRPSRMTPAEAAFYMGVPNLIMVRYLGSPALPFDQFAVPFKALRQVVWSMVGAGGQSDEAERRHVLELAERYPNFTGVMLDDFFAGAFGPIDALAALPLADLRALRDQVHGQRRPLDLWAVLYDYQLDKPLAPYVELLDKVNFWTWKPENLAQLERNFARVEKLAPQAGKVLGCYMWDYDAKRPLPLELMQQQCELGLKWLTQGRIEGLVFLATCLCDLDLETVEWTRDWIARVGNQAL